MKRNRVERLAHILGQSLTCMHYVSKCTCVSMNKKNVLLGRFVILTQPIGLHGVQFASRSIARVKEDSYIGIGTGITIVSSPPNALLPVVLSRYPVLDRLLDRSERLLRQSLDRGEQRRQEQRHQR